MRRRHSSRLAAGVTLLALLSGAGVADASGQSGVATDGALFLLLPVGARAVGMGQAAVATTSGSEAAWWNPAGLARLESYEAAIHHSQTFLATGDAVSVILPFSLLGVVGLSANLLNYGEQEVGVDESGSLGTILPRSFVYAATYGTPIGPRVSAGITYKIVQLRVDCTGACPNLPALSAATSALDFGMQYDLGPISPITIGASVRNLGLRFQVKDREQADPLPTRMQVGVLYRVPPIAELRETEIRLAGDLVDKLRVRAPSGRVGMEVIYQTRYSFRAGYVLEEGGGPAIGGGFLAGGLMIDIARVMGGFYAEAGEPPVHLSLRYQF